MLKNNNIDLRKEFKLLQNDFSIDILYIRSAKYIRCKCYNTLYRTGDPKCHICLGNGYLTSIEKIKAISNMSTPYSLKNALVITDKGAMAQSNEAYYFDYTVLPKAKDIIAITGWDKYGLATDILRVYEIDTVNEVRGDNGRVELYAVNVKLKTDLLEQVKNTINELPYGAKKILAERKRYVWPLKR